MYKGGWKKFQFIDKYHFHEKKVHFLRQKERLEIQSIVQEQSIFTVPDIVQQLKK